METEKGQKLIFVYNADSGIRNMIIDGAHKIFSPSTYECNLCGITYGMFTENTVWKKFRKENAMKMQFLHTDEFQGQYVSKIGNCPTFPVILMETEGNLEILINTAELDGLQCAENLIDLINART
ncbi:MAG: GTPase [Maribacter sp.]|nr:GTPase [Maribacter sp.]